MRPVQPPNTSTRKPKLPPLAGACDTHLHVYGVPARYPLSEERNYTPDSHSTLEDYLRVHRTLGLERAVIVTGSANGTNNQVTLDALARMQGKFKGLALLDPEITDSELSALNNAGMTGFRVKTDGKGGLSFDATAKIAARIAGFGWHVEFLSRSMAEAIAAVPFFNGLKMPYVFDHVAHAKPRDTETAAFKELLSILQNEVNLWVNLYSFYQESKAGPPDYIDMVPVVQAVIESRPDRVLWGSNWPHAGIGVPMPNDADLLDFLLAVAPDQQIRRLILVENPAVLYGWPTSDACESLR